MSKEGRISVVIADNKRIPFVGKGPITRPIKILRSQYEILKKLGYKVREVDELVKKPVPEEKHIIEEDAIEDEPITTSEAEMVDSIEEDEIEEALVEESVETEDTIEENEVDETEEDSNEEEIESEEDVDVTEVEIDIDTMTKREIKDELDKRGIEYNKNANLDKLKSLLMEGIEDEE